MLIPTFIMAGLAMLLLYVGYNKGQNLHLQGLGIATNMFIQIIPLLICSFIVAGMVQVLIPTEIISKWVGAESGLRGIVIGAAAGSLAPGGPFVSMPIAAGLLKAGASLGTMVAFLTGWAVLAVSRLPLEIGIMGWKFSLARLASSLLLPLLAGLIAQALFSKL